MSPVKPWPLIQFASKLLGMGSDNVTVIFCDFQYPGLIIMGLQSIDIKEKMLLFPTKAERFP